MPKQNIDFLVIGAQKSGTTSLFKYIEQHPALHLPKQKEVNFFANEDRYRRGVDWYIRTYFSGADERKLWGEVSPHYMSYSRAPARIHEMFPEAKLIAILRNPIDRSYSHYRMAVRRGTESRSFTEVLEARSHDEPLDLPETEETEDSPYILSFSLYGRVLALYLRYFREDQILVLFQENLLSNPHQVISEVFSFLGVDGSYSLRNVGKKYHVSGQKRFPGLESWVQRQGSLKRALKRALGSEKNLEAAKFWFEQFNVRPVNDEGPAPADRRRLKSLFEEDVALLQQLFSISTPWAEFGSVDDSRDRRNGSAEHGL